MGIHTDKSQMPAPSGLRRHAEERLRAKSAGLHLSRTAEEMQRVVHELEVHQIELEMQNEELHQAQDELELSRNKYAELFDFAPIGYFIFDARGVILEVNLAGAELLGIERQQLANRPFAGFAADAEGRDLFARHLESVFHTQGMQRCDIRITGKDGTVLHGHFKSVMLDTVGSNGGFILCSIIDGTAGKQLETEIQDAMEYAENIVETVREPLVVLNSDLKILTANHSFYSTFKVTPEATIGKFIYDVGNRQWDIPKLRVLVEEILPLATAFNGYEVQHDFPDIGRKTILLNARQIFRENIGSHIILLAMEDITERKGLEAEIQDALEYAENIVETVREPLVVLSSDLKILTANHSFYNTFKVTPEETAGNFIYDVGNRQWDIPALRVLFEEILPNDTVINGYEVQHDFPDIGRKTILLNARQIFREKIGSRIILLAMEDITERKAAGEEIERLNVSLAVRAADLENANRELEAFNYTVAHDLRNPLNVVSSYCQAIKEMCGSGLDEQCRHYLQEACDGTLRMNRLIEALLDFSRLTHAELKREEVDLSRMANEAAGELKRSNAERMAEVRISDGIVAIGDAVLLRVVLMNLLDNAWKYTGIREEAVIEFGAKEIDGKPVYFVRDNGAGFDNADADKLFVPFQRLPGAEECRGFGIGLATVERIIRRHGGRVWAEGEPGKGATFYFTLQA